MTGQELYEGWDKASSKVRLLSPMLPKALFSMLGPFEQIKWVSIAQALADKVPTAEDFVAALGKMGISLNTLGFNIVNELVQNWFGYFPQPTAGSSGSTESTKGDVWVFKASGLRATVLDISGSKVKLRLHGAETDWMEESDLATAAKREAKA